MARLSVVEESDSPRSKHLSFDFGEYEEVVRKLETENAELRRRIDSTSNFNVRSSLVHLPMGSRMSVGAATRENEEVLEINRELNDTVRDLRREHSLATQKLESLETAAEAAAQEHTHQVRRLADENRDLQRVKSRLEMASTLDCQGNTTLLGEVKTLEVKTLEEVKQSELERVPTDVVLQLTELQHELLTLRAEHEEARCELGELRFQADVDREASARELQELDEERKELLLLLEAKNEEVSAASEQIELLHCKISSDWSLRSANRKSERRTQTSTCSSIDLLRQMSHARLQAASSEDDERDVEPPSDGTEVEDGVSGAERRSHRAGAARPHASALQGSCDMFRQPQVATSNSSPAGGTVNVPESAYKCKKPNGSLASTSESSMWEMFKTSLACCGRHMNEPRNLIQEEGSR